jgi:hypothetical protein
MVSPPAITPVTAGAMIDCTNAAMTTAGITTRVDLVEHDEGRRLRR